MRGVKRASSDAQVDELPESRRWTADLRTPSGRASLEIRLPAPIFPVTSAIRTSAPICPVTHPGDRAAGAAGMMPGAGGQPLRRAGSGAPDMVGGAPPKRRTSFLRSRRLAMPDPSVVAAGICPASLAVPTRQDLSGSNDAAGGRSSTPGEPNGDTGTSGDRKDLDINTACGAGADNHHNARRSRRRPTVTPAVTAATAITASCTRATVTRPTDVSFCSWGNGSSAAVVVANVQDMAAVKPQGFAAAAKTVSLAARRGGLNQDVQLAMRKGERRYQTRQSDIVAEKTAAGPTAAPACVDAVGPYGSLTDRVAKRTRREPPTLPQPQQRQRQPLATRPSRVAAITLPVKVPAAPALQLPDVNLQEPPLPLPLPLPQTSTKARACKDLSDLMEGSPRQLPRLQKAVESDLPMFQLLKAPEPQNLPPSTQTEARLLEETTQPCLLPSGLPLGVSPPPAILDEHPSMPKERALAAALTLSAVPVVPPMAPAAAPSSPPPPTAVAPPQGPWAAARLQVPGMSAPDQATATATAKKQKAPAEAPPLPVQVPTALLQDHLALSLETLTALASLSKAIRVKEPVVAAPRGVSSPPEVPAAEEGQPGALAAKLRNPASLSVPSSCIDCGRKAGRTSHRIPEAPGRPTCKSCCHQKMDLELDKKGERVMKEDASADAPTGGYEATKSPANWRLSRQKAVPTSATAQEEPLPEQKQLATQEANAIPQSSFEPIRIVLWLYASQSAAAPPPSEPLPPRPAPASREQEQPTGAEEEDEEEEEEVDGGDSEENGDDDDDKGGSGCCSRGGGGGSSLSREAKRRQQLRQQKRRQAHLEKLEKFRRKRRRRERRALKRLVLQPAPGELAVLPPPPDFLTNLLPQPMPCFLPDPASEAGQRLAAAVKASTAAAAVAEVEAADPVAATAADGTPSGAAATRVQRTLPQPNSTPCLVCCRIARPIGCARQDGRYVCRTCRSSTMTWRLDLDADSTGGGGVGNASQADRAAVAAAGSASAATPPGRVADGAGGSGECGWVPVRTTLPAIGAVQLDVEWTADVVEEAVRLAELMMLVAAHERGGDPGGSRCGSGISREPQEGGKRHRR